jgi:peptide/nickel transport system substrate-binding protein
MPRSPDRRWSRAPDSPPRRAFLAAGVATLAVGAAGLRAAERPNDGGTLIIGETAEPTALNSALTTAGPTGVVATKIFDALLSYDLEFKPQPQLAVDWKSSPDGQTITMLLRPGVTWHDGTPFTSADVAFSVLEVWKKYNGRGRTTFANVVAVDTPNALTAVWRLSKPAPYLLKALAASESTVLPRHLYSGTDILDNPRNNMPVGTGPFRFSRWERGVGITLDRNPHYWDAPRPYLDQLIIRYLPDGTSLGLALEAGSVHVANAVTLRDLSHLERNPALKIEVLPKSYSPTQTQLDLNLDRPVFREVRVRQAFAHAIDRSFILQNVWHGYGAVADSPIPLGLGDFHAGDLPSYPFDLQKAEQLLDAVGLKRGADGTRLRIFNDPNPQSPVMQTALHIRSTFARIGVSVEVRSQDFGEYVNRVYTRRDFDTALFIGGFGPDPAIAVQRYYWSKNFQPGVAFSNDAHYANQRVDQLLESAQVEIEAQRRSVLYHEFQRIAMTELPYIPINTQETAIVVSRRVRDALTPLLGIYGNFAGASLAAA